MHAVCMWEDMEPTDWRKEQWDKLTILLLLFYCPIAGCEHGASYIALNAVNKGKVTNI